MLLILPQFERVRWQEGKLYSTSGHQNATTSSRVNTNQVAPSWLGFEACKSLESLLLLARK
jgi:hypothetical protein